VPNIRKDLQYELLFVKKPIKTLNPVKAMAVNCWENQCGEFSPLFWFIKADTGLYCFLFVHIPMFQPFVNFIQWKIIQPMDKKADLLGFAFDISILRFLNLLLLCIRDLKWGIKGARI